MRECRLDLQPHQVLVRAVQQAPTGAVVRGRRPARPDDGEHDVRLLHAPDRVAPPFVPGGDVPRVEEHTIGPKANLQRLRELARGRLGVGAAIADENAQRCPEPSMAWEPLEEHCPPDARALQGSGLAHKRWARVTPFPCGGGSAVDDAAAVRQPAGAGSAGESRCLDRTLTNWHVARAIAAFPTPLQDSTPSATLSAAGDDRPPASAVGSASDTRASGSSMRCGSARQSTPRSADRAARIRAGDSRPGSSVAPSRHPPLAVRRGDQLVERGQARGRRGGASSRAASAPGWRTRTPPPGGAGEPEDAAHLLQRTSWTVSCRPSAPGSSRAARALASSRLTRRRTFVRTVASGRMRRTWTTSPGAFPLGMATPPGGAPNAPTPTTERQVLADSGRPAPVPAMRGFASPLRGGRVGATGARTGGRTSMRSNRLWIGVTCGVALALGVVAAVDAGTQTAGAEPVTGRRRARAAVGPPELRRGLTGPESPHQSHVNCNEAGNIARRLRGPFLRGPSRDARGAPRPATQPHSPYIRQHLIDPGNARNGPGPEAATRAHAALRVSVWAPGRPWGPSTSVGSGQASYRQESAPLQRSAALEPHPRWTLRNPVHQPGLLLPSGEEGAPVASPPAG